MSDSYKSSLIIEIITLNGMAREYLATPETSILDVKTLWCASMFGPLPCCLRLFYKGVELKDDSTLAENNITTVSTLHVVYKNCCGYTKTFRDTIKYGALPDRCMVTFIGVLQRLQIPRDLHTMILKYADAK